MRLIDIANRNYLIALTLIFLVGSVGAYYILKSIINHEFNEKLFAEKEQLIYELHTFDDLQNNYYLNIGDVIELQEVPEDPGITPFLRDTTMYDPYEKKELPFRALTFSDQFQGRHYVITITKSLLPNQDLIEGISEIMIGLVIILAVSLGLLNRFLFKNLWAPFYQILNQMKVFNIKDPRKLSVEKTRVEEFNQLKHVLDIMIDKSIKDFVSLKEYTENTSHEIQTPLAIIKNKAELLLQEPLTEDQLSEVAGIYEATRRLSRLKEGLTTLTKIDNNQYVEKVEIDLMEYLKKKLDTFSELIELKKLKVTIDVAYHSKINMNQDLAYMLFSNLLSNAIKYNIPGGKIEIILTEHQVLIKNHGQAPEVPTEKLFDRFRRSGNHRDSTGLGLSLVKRICDYYRFPITYQYAEPWHMIFLDFKNTAV